MNIKSLKNAKQTKTDTNGNQFHGKNRARVYNRRWVKGVECVLFRLLITKTIVELFNCCYLF